MKTLKIVLALVGVIGLASVTIGFTFAHYTSTPFDYMHNYTTETVDGNWWNDMREHMEARWSGIEDEAWFEDMTQYMEEHWTKVQNQPWYDEMIEYMEERGYGSYAGSDGFNRRGFGCWGW